MNNKTKARLNRFFPDRQQPQMFTSRQIVARQLVAATNIRIEFYYKRLNPEARRNYRLLFDAYISEAQFLRDFCTRGSSWLP